MEANHEFVHEVDLGRVPWAQWVCVGWLAAMSVLLWCLLPHNTSRARIDPVAKLLLLTGAGLFQALLAAMAGLVLADGRFRAGLYRVVLTEAELRVAYPPAPFGFFIGGQSFIVAVAQIERLVVDRYPYSGDGPGYSVQSDDGTRHCLVLPRGDDDEVWPRLFAAIRRLRPAIVLEDWTHTLRGRIPTHAEPEEGL